MKLSELRLFGFKTFADQTTLGFEPGITAIVGPNGAGKSNLVDAIRWVLGEQSPKSLRSSKTEDVIFAGNERRKPLGMAEVALTFDNADGSLAIDAAEVQITRRAYRAGESEFFINRQQVRLRDIVDLLMGTGLGPGSYSIVSQGQIDAILSSKPTERRSLFEETAGINRFLSRKTESLRRLEHTERNAIRVNDLLAEITGRIPELETQARRARRFRRASARLRDLEILSYLRASATRRAEREALVAERDRLEAQRTAAAARVATVDAHLNALRSEAYLHEQRREVARAQTGQVRNRLAELEAQSAALRARREALERQSAAVDDDRERAATERSTLETELVDLEAQIGPSSAALRVQREHEQAAVLAVSGARADLDAIYTQLREVEAAVAAGAACEAERGAQRQALSADIDRLERDAREARADSELQQSQLVELGSACERLAHDAADRERDLGAAEHAVAEADARLSAATEALARDRERFRAATSDLASAEARSHTIEELEANLAGHIPGTRAILEAGQRGELGGIVGVVANLIRVEERYARALDVAFGAALSNLVTETSEDAERAIQLLRSRELGRATFLPLDTLGSRTGRDPAGAPDGAGVIGYAHTLVETQLPYAGIVAFLVGRILVVETLDVGVRLVRAQGFRDSIVTLDGDQILGGGAMTGGRYKRERSILSRQAQLRTLRAQIPELQAALAAAERQAAAAAAEATVATSGRDAARQRAGELTIALRDVRSQSERLEAERERLERAAEVMAQRGAERDREIVAARERLGRLTLAASDPAPLTAERTRLEAVLIDRRAAIAAAEVSEREVAARTARAREAVAALTAKCDAARGRLDMLDADRERAAAARQTMLADVESTVVQLAKLTTSIQSVRSEVDQLEAADESARRERDAMSARTAGLESDLRLAQNAEREGVGAAETGRLRLAEVEAELGMLSAQFAQNPATADECADVEARYVKEEGDFAADVARLREELVRLANVNLNAEAEIEELVERERFLREQLDDLARARETLLASIKEIEATSLAQFNETFVAVKAAFEEVFARLFVGGQARMWQTEADELSETGIEISIQPPGKKMTALPLLSGGERAMTAAALIFALIKVKPSPFYLLDEVDAALDDANVERFSDMVREVAGGAQLVLVTHNKQTMELAERMYGVTMAEPGISSVVAADLAPVESRRGEPALVG